MANEQEPVQKTSADVLAAKIAEAVATATAKATLQVQSELKVIEKTPRVVVSCFNPRATEAGYRKPDLSRKTLFCGREEQAARLLPEEIELYNKIVRPGRYHSRRWEVIITEDSDDPAKHVIDVRVPCREIQDRMELPSSLTAILRDIVEEQSKRDADDLKKPPK